MLSIPEINSHSSPVARTLANDLDYCVNLGELEWSSGVERIGLVMMATGVVLDNKGLFDSRF